MMPSLRAIVAKSTIFSIMEVGGSITPTKDCPIIENRFLISDIDAFSRVAMTIPATTITNPVVS